MAGLSDSIDLLFRIKADGSQATSELKKVENDVKGATSNISKEGSSELDKLFGSIAKTGEGFESFGSTVGAVGTIITGEIAVYAAFAATAFAVGKELFNLADGAAKYGDEIGDASDRTGLSVQTLSALKFQADASGESFEGLLNGVSKFNKTIAEAAEGSKGAADKLKRLGIDPQAAIKDLDGALEQVLKRIIDLPPGVEQAKAATDAFGKSGDKLLPFLNDFNGNLPELIAHCKELGVTLSDQDAKAAGEFEKSVGAAKAQTSLLAVQIGKEFIPVFIDLAKRFSAFLAENKDNIKAFGQVASAVFRDTLSVIGAVVTKTLEFRDSILGAIRAIFPALTTIVELAAKALGLYSDAVLNKPKSIADLRHDDDTDTKPAPTSDYTANTKVDKSGESAAKKAEEARKKRLDLDIQEQELKQKTEKNTYEQSKANADALLKAQAVSLDDFRALQFAAIVEYQAKVSAYLTQQEAIVRERFKGKEQDNELEKIKQQRQALEKELNADTEKASLETRNLKIKIRESENKQYLDTEKARIEKEQSLTEEKYEKLGFQDAEYFKKKTQNSIDLITFEKKQVDDLAKYTSEILTQEAKERQLNAEDLLKNNTEYQALVEKSRQLGQVRQKAQADGERELAKFKTDTNKQVEAQKLEAERQSTNQSIDQARRSYEEAIRLGVKKSENLTNLYNLEHQEIDRNAQLEKDRNEKERAEQLQKVKGLENEKELVQEINDLYDKRNEIVDSEKENKQTENDKRLKPQINKESGGDFLSGIADGLGQSVITETDAAGKAVTNLGNIFKEMGAMASQSIVSLAQGIGSLVQNFVLLGNAGGQSMRKLVASVLASVSAQAAVIAVMELAYGIAALTPWGAAIYGPALPHFQASALMASVAVGSGLIGRGIAGDSFKNASSGSAISGGGTGSSGSQGSTTPVDRTIMENRLQQQRQPTTRDIIEMRFPRGMIEKEVIDSINNKSEVHGAMVKLVIDNA